MKQKYPKILEILWLIVAILCLLSAIHQTIYEGILKSYLFIIFAIISFAIYFLRRKNRLRS